MAEGVIMVALLFTNTTGLTLRRSYSCISQNPCRTEDYSYCPNVVVVSVVVLVFICLVIVVTVSNPGVIRVSWIENAAPSFNIENRGIASKFGEVQLNLLPQLFGCS